MAGNVLKPPSALVQLHDVKARNAALQLQLSVLQIEGNIIGLGPNDLTKWAKGFGANGSC